METKKIHTLILGAGPAGLTAGYTLAKAGLGPVVLERDKVCGGLMRSVQWRDFTLDIGRKELYNRIAKVDAFWQRILGDNYRLYSHRGGILYDGLILDTSPAYRGFRRGMPWKLFLECCSEFLSCQLRSNGSKPGNLEEYFYQHRGRRLSQIFSQGFQEKLTGRKWAEAELPNRPMNGAEANFFRTTKDVLVRTFSSSEPNTYKGEWRHPSKGTGQICEFLDNGIRENGGTIYNQAKLLDMTSRNGRICSVTAEINNEMVVFEPTHVVSSIPIEYLVQVLLKKTLDDTASNSKTSPFRKKTVVLVYVFLDDKPKFPHAWLNVTCPKTRIGRITNYAMLNGDMVPEGKSCFCIEYYCFDEDQLLQNSDDQFAEMALGECEKFQLLDRSKCFGHRVIRLPGADASQNRHNWLSKIRLGLLEELKPITNLYYVNRTDLDIATLAGMEAGEAIISGDRSEFDRHIDPTQIGIRSEKKVFEFKL